MSRCVLHLDLDVFFVAVERLLNPALNCKPVIVSPGTGRSVVAAASYEARAFGVHSAMPFAQARRLCPQAIVCPGNYEAYQEYSRAFFQILRAYSPDLEPASLDEAYLEYTGCEKLFGPPRLAADHIQQRIRAETGLDASIGIATSKLVAKIASDLAKPAGILHVLPGYEAVFLAPLPVRRMPGVGPKSEPRLHSLGIRTIGDLARIPRSALQQAFGEYGGHLHALALGQDQSLVELRGQAKSISHEETFSQDTTDPKALRVALQRLVCEAGYRVRRQGLKARTVCVKVRYADFSLHTRSRTLAEASDLDRVLFETAQDLLKIICTRRVRIRLLGFAAQNLEAGHGQMDLLGLASKQRLTCLQNAADKVRGRYGFDTVRWASLLRQEVEQ